MTKLFPLLAAALVAVAGAASAENEFTFDGAQSTASSVALTGVEADQAGTIRVYAAEGANGFGQRLGSARIDAGVTGTLAIALDRPFDGNLAIVMMGPDLWAAQLTTVSPSTSADSSAFASAPLTFASGLLARAPSSAETSCVVTSSDGRLVHDSRGNLVTC